MHMMSHGTLLFVLVAGIAHLNCQIVIILSQAHLSHTRLQFPGENQLTGRGIGVMGHHVTTMISHLVEVGGFSKLVL